MTADLTLDAFLLARIAEDEAAVEWATEQGGLSIGGDEHGYPTIPRSRVLAECAAKRLIVELRYSWNLQAEKFTEPPFGPILQTQVNTADAVLRTLARVYAEHPDYREEWKP